MIEVKKTKRFGRGLYASKNIRSSQLLFEDPVLILTATECRHNKHTIIERYQYDWNGGSAIALGNGSLFNHSAEANVVFKQDYRRNKMVFKSTRPIKAGEQLFIDYGYDPF